MSGDGPVAGGAPNAVERHAARPAADEVDVLVDAERRALLAVLSELDAAQWSTPSLCAGWTVRDLVVHLLMPYELPLPRFLGLLAAARFRFDAQADRWARQDPRTTAEVMQGLAATASRRFRVPGAPPEAPLSHLLIHVEDIYRPLGIARPARPRSAQIVLDQMTGPRFARSLPSGLLDGVSLAATDVDWSYGSGPLVVGTASALIAALAGRPAGLAELSGPGASGLRARASG